MGRLRYNDSFEPPYSDPRVQGVMFVLVAVLWLGKSAYELWRDWHHRLSGLSIVDALIAAYLVSWICSAARQAWRKVRGSGGTDKGQRFTH